VLEKAPDKRYRHVVAAPQGSMACARVLLTVIGSTSHGDEPTFKYRNVQGQQNGTEPASIGCCTVWKGWSFPSGSLPG